jgi:hypothetical protein
MAPFYSVSFLGRRALVAKYVVNEAGVAKARALIESRHYVVRSRWADVQPTAKEGTAFLKAHSWDAYGAWHLARKDGTTEDTKAHYGFVFGDFGRLHRMGLISCLYRAAEWDHKEIELAAHDLLQRLDAARASRRRAR